jgi:hypothetical protein
VEQKIPSAMGISKDIEDSQLHCCDKVLVKTEDMLMPIYTESIDIHSMHKTTVINQTSNEILTYFWSVKNNRYWMGDGTIEWAVYSREVHENMKWTLQKDRVKTG